MKTLDCPDINMDGFIIANFRAMILNRTGSNAGRRVDTLGILPFSCPPRGYVVDEDSCIILMFDPDIIDIDEPTIMALDLPLPLEVYYLEDDKITNFLDINRS